MQIQAYMASLGELPTPSYPVPPHNKYKYKYKY